jgi:hypothetical protein
MKAILKIAMVGAALVGMFCADITAQAPLGVGFVPDAHAIIGLPFTPLSFAGVARRTAFRTMAYAGAATASQAAAANAAAANAAAANAAAARAAAAAAPPPPVAAGQPLPLGTIVHTLPAGCTSTPVGGVDYFYCGGNFYRAAFSGNNLVYVTAQP